jgi:outer membrane protein assembly factor BamB
VLVASLVATQVALDRREAARLAELAAIPGVLPPADPSIGVIWRADPQVATALQSGAMVGDVLVGGIQDPAGAPSIIGLDPATGVVAWTTPVDLPTPQPTPTSSSPTLWITCSAVPHGDAPVAVCVSQQYGEDVQGIPPSAVWVLDPADGDLLADRVVDGGVGLAFAAGAQLQTERLAAEGGAVRWRLTARDVVTGDTRWTWTTPPTDATGPESGEESPGYGGAALQADEDRVLLTVDGRAWVLTPAGRLERDIRLAPTSWVSPARAGTHVVSSWTSTDQYSATLLLPDGTQVPTDETAAWLGVDDGSAPGVVLMVGDARAGPEGITGRSARTGERLWHLEGPVVTGVLLDGTLYLAVDGGLRAVDATTGDTVWSTRVDHLVHQLSTDGRYLLVPGPGVTLEAYALRDGSLDWTADLAQEVADERDPVFVQGFQQGWHDPRLYVWMDSGTVAVLG